MKALKVVLQKESKESRSKGRKNMSIANILYEEI